MFLLRNVYNKMAEAVRPVKKKKKAKKLHTEGRGRLGETLSEKEKGIVAISRLYSCWMSFRIKFYA